MRPFYASRLIPVALINRPLLSPIPAGEARADGEGKGGIRANESAHRRAKIRRGRGGLFPRLSVTNERDRLFRPLIIAQRIARASSPSDRARVCVCVCVCIVVRMHKRHSPGSDIVPYAASRGVGSFHEERCDCSDVKPGRPYSR